MILICISSNILSFECGDSFCCHDMYLTLPAIIKLCYHIIMYLHINTTHIHYHCNTVSYTCAIDLPYVTCTCIILHYTIKHDMPHFLYPCFTQYRSSHVTCVVHFKCVILSHIHNIRLIF